MRVESCSEILGLQSKHSGQLWDGCASHSLHSWEQRDKPQRKELTLTCRNLLGPQQIQALTEKKHKKILEIRKHIALDIKNVMGGVREKHNGYSLRTN